MLLFLLSKNSIDFTYNEKEILAHNEKELAYNEKEDKIIDNVEG